MKPKLKLNRFHIFSLLCVVYAAFIFFLSSLSKIPSPPHHGLLRTLATELMDLMSSFGLRVLIYPFYLVYLYPDKFGHIGLYFFFGLLLNRALSNSRMWRYAIPASLLIGTLYGATDELHQSFVPYRTPSEMDLLADFLGLLCAQIIIALYTGMRKLSKRRERVLNLDLWMVILLSFLACLFVIAAPPNLNLNLLPLRIIFALPLLLFLPGYGLIAAMFPRKNELSSIERFTLSIGLSIAITVFDGFAISLTEWRFRPAPIVISLSLITLALVLVTAVRRVRIPIEERFYIDSSVISAFIASIRRVEKPNAIEIALITALVGSILIASGMLIYAKLTYKEERFTAFYILGEGGKAEKYPGTLYLLEPSSVIVGIENHEHAPVNYTLEITLGGHSLLRQQIPVLAHGSKWENRVSFTPTHVGKHLKLEFLLYKGGSKRVYRSLHLWVDSLINYDHLEVISRYILASPPRVVNPDMEYNSNWTFRANTGYFRGFFTKFHELNENSTVCGYITDNDTGLPVPAARVSLTNHYGYEKRSTTNETGYYEMTVMADHFWAEATAPGYEKSTTEFDIADGQTKVVNFSSSPIKVFNMTLRELANLSKEIRTKKHLPENLSARFSILRGYVLDNVTGQGVANASIKARSEYGIEANTTTDETGYFELRVISGRSQLEVHAEGYAVNRTTVEIASEHMINLKLNPAQSVVLGYISDNETGAPVPGAYIQLRGEGYADVTRSNATGYYELRTVEGHVRLEVSKEGYLSNSTAFNISYGETIMENLSIAAIPPPPTPAIVYGRVTYNGTGLPGVRVEVSDHKGYEKSGITDSTGYFEIETRPGHLWLDVIPGVYMSSGGTEEFEIKSGEKARIDVNLEAYSTSTYQIEYPAQTPIEKGAYGEISQVLWSDAPGLATLRLKVCDSHRSNGSAGYLYKQVLVNGFVVWEDDVAGDEGWQEVKMPVTLDNGTNRLTLRVYAKQSSTAFPLTVWWDDIHIEPLEELTKHVTTSFYVRDRYGGDNYPAELYLGEPAEVIVGITNRAPQMMNYTLQVRLNGDILRSEVVRVDAGSTWERLISFTPNQVGRLLKLEFLLFKGTGTGTGTGTGAPVRPYKEFHLWVTSDINYENPEVLERYAASVSPLPEIVNGDMETSTGWRVDAGGNASNFSVRITNSTFVSPWHSFEISATMTPPHTHADIYQDFTARRYPAVVVLSFAVKDSCRGDGRGYYVKQVLLNDEPIWEDEIAGDEEWQHLKIPVTLRAATNRLTLRVYTTAGGGGPVPVPVRVWWDDVKIEPVTAMTVTASTSASSAASFYVLDANGTDENYPTKLHLGEPATVLVGVRRMEPGEANYILQVRLDGRVLKTLSRWLGRWSEWEQKVSFVPDRVGESQKLEFLLFRDLVRGEPYRRFSLWVSTTVDYSNLEPLLEYELSPLPVISGGEMGYSPAWRQNYRGSSFEAAPTAMEYTSPSYSYCVRQRGETRRGDYMELSQSFYTPDYGIALLSFNVRDSFNGSSSDAHNITKQVLLNGRVIWEDDISGIDTGYVGWVSERYSIEKGKWIRESPPAVKAGWLHVDIPVYMNEGNTRLGLRVYARGDAKELPVKVYWDDVKIRALSEMVKTGEGIRMVRVG